MGGGTEHTHTFAESWSSDETYHWHAATCEHTDEVSDLAMHVWDDGETTTEPTCTQPGEKIYTCTVCNKTKTEKLEATGHTFQDEWESDETYHWHTCRDCDEIDDKAEHTFIDNVCTVCDYTNRELAFSLSADGTYYVVTGMGTCTDTELEIPSAHGGKPVSGIADEAFDGCDDLTSIAIPDSITYIGENAFRGCSSLKNIALPDSVTEIGSSAFGGCSALESITLPFAGGSAEAESASPSTLFGYIFGTSSYAGSTRTEQKYSEGLSATYYIPSSLKDVTVTGGSIRYGAFMNCASLENVTVGDKVTEIGSSAFGGCSALESITLPFAGGSAEAESASPSTLFGYIFGTSSYTGGAETKQSYAAGSGSSVTYYIPSSLKDVTVTGGSIRFGAFMNCASLESVVLGDGVSGSIGTRAFSGCSALNDVTIGDGVTAIEIYAFFNCRYLTSLTIGKNVTSIDDAFTFCYSLVEIRNLSSIDIATTDKADANGGVARYALNVLTSEAEESTITHTDDGYIFCEADGTAYLVGYKREVTALSLPDNFNGNDYKINGYAFIGHDLLERVTIPDGVTGIGDSAFQSCDSLSTISIPNSVTSIGVYAFWNCVSLKSISVPDRVEIIRSSTFSECTSLKSIAIGKSVAIISWDAFEGCTSLTEITVDKDNASFCSEDGVLYSADKTQLICYPAGKTDLSYTVPEGVTDIGHDAFFRCTNIQSISIPRSVTNIGYKAFQYCSSLKNIKFSGTIAEWNAIEKYFDWESYSDSFTVNCTDGNI